MAYTEAQKRATLKWIKKNYSLVHISFKKDEKEIVKQIAADNNKSVNRYIVDLIKENNPDRFRKDVE